MGLLYFDSSALVKLVVDEPGSEVAAQLWNACDAALASRLAYPEVRATLAAARRNHDLDEGGFATALHLWEELWAGVRAVELTATVERHAGDLAQQHALRGADAVHLASALAVDEPRLVVVAWDRRLHRGAVAVGLAAAPADVA